MRAQKRDTGSAQKCARRLRRRAHFCVLRVSRFCARICQLAHEIWHGVQIIWPPTVLILLVIFLNIFGETCPNSILRAKRDAALSLARGVFEFFHGTLRV